MTKKMLDGVHVEDEAQEAPSPSQDVLMGHWKKIIMAAHRPLASEELCDGPLSTSLAPWASLPIERWRRHATCAAIAALGPGGMPKSLTLALGNPTDSKEEKTCGLSWGARLDLAVWLLGLKEEKQGSFGAHGSWNPSPSARSALAVLVEGMPLEVLNGASNAGGVGLLAMMMEGMRHACWALGDLATWGLRMDGGGSGLSAAYLAAKLAPDGEHPAVALLPALSAGSPPGRCGLAPAPLDVVVDRMFERKGDGSPGLDRAWARHLRSHGASLSESLNVHGHSFACKVLGKSYPNDDSEAWRCLPRCLMEMNDGDSSMWEARDASGYTALFHAANPQGLGWWGLLADVDAGWGMLNAVGRSAFDVALRPLDEPAFPQEVLAALAARFPQFIAKWAQENEAQEVFGGNAEWPGFKSEVGALDPSTKKEVACKAQSLPHFFEEAFVDWANTLSLKEVKNIQAKLQVALDAAKSSETVKEVEAKAEDASTSTTPVPDWHAVALSFEEAWSKSVLRCGPLGSLKGIDQIVLEDLGDDLSKLRSLASAVCEAVAKAWGKDEGGLAGFFGANSEHKAALGPAVAGAIFCLRPEDALGAAGDFPMRAGWAWGLGGSWPEGFGELWKAFAIEARKLAVQRDMKSDVDKSEAGRGPGSTCAPTDGEPTKAKQELAAPYVSYGDLVRLAFNNAPLALAHGSKGRPEPRTRPVQPLWEICKQKDIDAFKALGAESVGDKDIYKGFRKKMDAGGDQWRVRPLAPAEALLESIGELRLDFPHFSDVIDHLEDHCTLQMAGDGSFFIPPMLLAGPPGVGKTFFFKRVSEAVDTAYKVLQMESMTASFIITGLAQNWGGAATGCVFELLANGQSANPIILLDEIDKCAGARGYAPDTCLLPLLEPHSARTFQDECLPLKLDARRICWVATANVVERVSVPLRSRLDVFHVRPPSQTERRALCAGVYKSILSASAWGSKMSRSLGEDVLDKAAKTQGEGATRDLRRAFTTACAKALRSGRSEIGVDDLPSVAEVPRALWDAVVHQGGVK